MYNFENLSVEKNELLDRFSQMFKEANNEDKLKIASLFKKSTGFEINTYQNPKPIIVSVVLVEDEDNSLKILGIKRGNKPHIGEICLPGGYIDNMENAQMAAARELKEETNITLNSNGFKIFDTQISKRNTLMIFAMYYKVIPSSKINWSFTNDENQELVKISKNMKLCFETHNMICQDYFNYFEYLYKQNIKLK